MKSIRYFLLVSAVVALASPCLAETFSFERVVELPPYQFDQQEVDVIGIKPGQPAAEALRILNDYFGEDKVETRSMWFGTRELRSEKFEAEYKAGRSGPRDDDGVSVQLGSPSIGSEVIVIKRNFRLDIQKPRPTLDEMEAQLINKYGAPVERTTEVRRVNLVWNFGSAGKCMNRKANEANGPYEPREFEAYASEENIGCDVIVEATVFETPMPQDGKVNSVQINIIDVKRRAVNAKADLSLFNTELAKFNNRPADVPKL